MSFELNRKQYSALYGPTIGDSVRLADTELFATVEKDLTVPGEEALFGGGKVIRAGMRTAKAPGRAGCSDHQCTDH